MGMLVKGLDTGFVRAIRQDGPDANGQVALRKLAVAKANPCRHCLGLIEEGEPMLVLVYRPFNALQPYAEVGPIFLHAKDCTRYESDRLPGWFVNLQPALIRGYGGDDWIRYETGSVVPGEELDAVASRILSDPEVEYVHIRSKFNCFLCRVERN